MTITLTREEAQQVLDAVNTAYGAACFRAAKILRDKLSEPNIVQDAIVYGTGITKDGKRIEPASIYKEPEPSASVEPEHVATIGNWGKVMWEEGVYPQLNDKLYTAPPQRKWQGLTEDDWNEFMMDHLPSERYGHTRMRAVWDFSQSKLKEKNT
jgi:hypothetical protein